MLIKFILKRLLHFIPLLFIISIVVYSMVLLIPGDPTYAILGQEASDRAREALREELGLNDPIYAQYGNWLMDAVQGDLGRSLMTKEKVFDIVLRNAGATLQLVLFSIIITISVGLVMGVLSFFGKGTIWETFFRVVSNVGVAIPNFVIGLLLVLVLSVWLKLLPATGFVSAFENPIEFLKTVLMPALALAAPGISIISRQIYSALIEALDQDYINTALSKGLKYNRVIIKHGFQNALLPVVTTIGVLISTMIGGTVILESVFAIPGLGQVIINAILQRDIPLLQGAILIMVFLVVIVNFLVDITYSIVDPRIKL